MIELVAADEHKFSAYRADPAEAPKGAVVIAHDIYGLTPHITSMADSFAAQGYVSIAPALFDRAKPGVALGDDDAAVAEGRQLAEQVGLDGPLADITAAVKAAGAAGRVAVVGFGWGGQLAYTAANRLSNLACAIAYYGNGIQNEYREKRRIPALLHFTTEPPADAVEQFRTQRPEVALFRYPTAREGFDCKDRSVYDQQAAAQAGERTLFWISQYVQGQAPILLKNAGSYAQAKTERKKKKKESADMGPPEA